MTGIAVGTRNRLTLNATLLLSVAAALLPFALLNIWQSIAVRENLHRMIGERLVASAAMTAMEQRDPILMARRILETMALEENIRAASSNCSSYLAERLNGRLPLVNFIRWDTDGRLQCSAVPPTQPDTYAEPKWWDDARGQDHFVLSAPVFGKVVPRRMLIAVQPLFDRTGKWDGSLSAGIDLSWIEQSLAQRRLSPRALVGITDANGKILTSSGPAGFSRINLKASTSRASVVQGSSDEAWIYASASLYENQLFVFYAEPQNMAFSISREQFRYSLILPLTAILLTCLALWLSLDRFVIRWLRRTGDRVRQMSDGDYKAQPDLFRAAPVELQQLGLDLDTMAQSVDRRDQALRGALAAKDAMAREVNHRVKNNLQMITSLVSLQASRLSDPEARRLMTQTRLRVSALALVQRLIYEVNDSERGAVDTGRLFSELCAQVESNFRPSTVKVKCHSDLGVVTGDQAVAAALIVVEAITNAFRHAFPAQKEGSIRVLLRREGAVGVLTIEDDGIGDLANSTESGMGLELMHALTAQLEGTFTLSETQGGGRTLLIRFPCPETDGLV